MFKSTLRSLTVVLALCLAACGSTPQKPGSTAKDPQSAYNEAMELLDAGSYETAITAFEQLQARFPYGRHAQQADLQIAYTYYRMQDTASAIAACDRFIRQYPDNPNVAYAYYLKGLAYTKDEGGWLAFLPQQPISERDQKAMRDAFDTFRIIVTQYPDSQYAADAHKRMTMLVNGMAQLEINVARYYLNRRAPLAAVNRAQIVLKNYPDTDAVEEALGIMVQGYDTLQLDTLKADAERVLRQNYPQSRFLAQR
jgi:outer membrane protein assembly factor BamD